jgi:hypothetical protein
MYNSDYNKCDSREEKKERKEEKSCVTINVFCDNKKKENGNKDECKKDWNQKEENTCVTVNIFCDDCKK